MATTIISSTSVNPAVVADLILVFVIFLDNRLACAL
jgi:hypothetical protein